MKNLDTTTIRVPTFDAAELDATTIHVATVPSVRPAGLVRRVAIAATLCALVATIAVTWLAASPVSAGPGKPRPAPSHKVVTPPPAPAPAATDDARHAPPTKRAPAKPRQVTGKLNLNNATVAQLTLLPGVGPSKAERVVAWRTKNGGFKRIADLRKVRGFGYKTVQKLEPYLDVKGETTLAAK
ncbi:MAG: helix-hairpin-helix domain-containing protein [Kofleriaceae bacterium]|nr:helix-hairpin-helix domain-containing protein [Kofleriaceae bacterium]MCB9571378.1 helix-hairpin-helix domain-containing protein [Kofleriaceae bacterium]